MNPLIYTIFILGLGLASPGILAGQTRSSVDSPNKNRGRFVDNHDGTATDRMSGLIWITNPHALPDNMLPKTWDEAVELCKRLNFAKSNEWRLPTVAELLTLVDYDRTESALPESSPFIGVPRSNAYWTSTAFSQRKDQAWIVDLKFGSAEYTNSKTNSKCYVLPVRSENRKR